MQIENNVIAFFGCDYRKSGLWMSGTFSENFVKIFYLKSDLSFGQIEHHRVKMDVT